MKSLSAITLAAAVVVSSSAFAAPAKSNTKAKASAVKSGATTPVTTIGLPSNVSPAPAAGSTAGSLKEAIPSKWSANAYLESSLGVQDASNGTGTMAAAAFIGANYKLDAKKSAYIRQNFGAKLAIDAKSQDKYSLADTELGLGLGKLIEFANGKGGIALTNRLYLPTGESSRRVGQIAAIREVIKTSYQVNKTLEVGHILDPRLYVQSRQSHMNAGKEVENNIAKLPQYAFAEAKLNDTFSSAVAFGTVDVLTLRGTRASESYLDIAGSAQLTKALALTLGIDNSANIGSGQEKRHAFFRPSETAYYMNLFASM